MFPQHFFESFPWILCIAIFFVFWARKRSKKQDLVEDPLLIFLFWLITGFTFAAAYSAIDVYSSQSVLINGNKAFEFYLDYVYFSFVTLSTLGYGDIHPSSEHLAGHIVRTLTIIESSIGIALSAGFAITSANKINNIRSFFFVSAARSTKISDGEFQMILHFTNKYQTKVDDVFVTCYAVHKDGFYTELTLELSNVGVKTGFRASVFRFDLELSDVDLGLFRDGTYAAAVLGVKTSSGTALNLRYYKIRLNQLIYETIPKNDYPQVNVNILDLSTPSKHLFNLDSTQF